MQIYHYDPATGVYTGTGLADPDPLDEGNWLVPAHATTRTPPPVQPGQRAVFDPALAVWTLQADVPGAPPPEPGPVPLPQQQAAAVREIDGTVDAIYAAVIGNRAQEYLAAEQAARSFAAAEFAGPVPEPVASWADASGMTSQAAAQDILAQAAAWTSARDLMRRQRLLHKRQAVQAPTAAALGVVLGNWRAFVLQLRSMLEA